jgi:hypothetical protein
MKVGQHHWLTRLYPAAWRARYGDEMDELLQQEGCGWREALDVGKAAIVEHLRRLETGTKAMQTYPESVVALVRKPSSIIPILMSGAALAVVVAAVTLFGARPKQDEGAAAHLFQIMIAGQLPFVAWFASQRLRRDFKTAVIVIGFQIGAILIALFPVWYFGL